MQRSMRIDPDVVSALTLGIKGPRVNTLERRSSHSKANEVKLPNECNVAYISVHSGNMKHARAIEFDYTNLPAIVIFDPRAAWL